MLANAVVFTLTHLLFWNWIALAMTFAGSLIFAHGYRHGGFAMAVVLHSGGGCIVFTSGLSRLFYHGAVASS